MNRASSTAGGFPPEDHDPYAALRFRDFRLYLSGSFLSNVGLHMQATAVFWEIYKRTDDPLALGFVGLTQVLPVICLALVAGHVADRLNRKYILMAALMGIAVASFGLATVSAQTGPIPLMYGYLFLIGVARAFVQPARASFLPHLVPRRHFSNAVTWGTTGFQLAAVIGPAASGIILATWAKPAIVYAYDGFAAIAFCTMISLIRYRRPASEPSPMTLENLGAGLKFVMRRQVILGAIGLDMFAVLFGGVVALLPVYQKDVLGVGAAELGCLQAAPAVGALCMSFILAHRPPMKHAGRALLWSIAGFGVATIVFGLSRSFYLSLGALFMTGAMDNISVVVRHTLVQLLTPDSMRGRVSAINGMFISISNELGGFESGMVAGAFTRLYGQSIGATIAAASGGVGTLLIVMAAAWKLPELRRFGRLDATPVDQPAESLAP